MSLQELQEETLLYFKASQRKALPILSKFKRCYDWRTDEIVDDDDYDDLDEDKEEKDLEIVDESSQYSTRSVVMSVLDTFPIFGMFNDASVKENVLALTSKTKTLLINRQKETDMKNHFAPL